MRKATVFFVMLPALILAGTAWAGGSAPITVGSEKQLFIDELFFDTADGVSLKIHPPRKTGEKNLQRDRPWESVTLNWFSVMKDAGKYRMWYECYDVEGWPTSDDTSFCFAESADGMAWTKPALGLVTYKESTDNNILFRMIGPEGGHSRVHGSQVFKDPKAPPEARYKAASQGIFSALGTPPHRIAGMHSPDGIEWTRYDEPICDIFADSQYSAFWDTALKQYVLFGRVGGRGRAIGRSVSSDFTHFAPLELVLQSDDSDPPDSDLYNPAAMKYPYAANAYFMMPSLFQHGPQTLDIRLAVSRDGVAWSRPEQGTPFIPLGEAGDFDSGSLYMGQGMLRAGDALWLYYGGSPLKHDEDALETGTSRTISRVVSRLDGFVSAEADTAVGEFVTPPLVFHGNLLTLNVAVREGGSLRVGLLEEDGTPVAGRAIDDCEAITGDHIAARVFWKSGGDISRRATKPTRMRIQMANASLYAFQFTTGYAQKGRDH